MLDKLFFIILVLNATDLFRFLAPQFGVEIGQVSIALLGLHGIYLLARQRYLVPLLCHTDMKYWLVLLLFWPLASVFYAPTMEIRQVALQLYYASLFCAAVVYAMANGLAAVHRVMTVSLALTIFGLVLSMVAPEYFDDVAQLAEGREEYQERAFGFFMQPNSAATGLAFLFLGWYSLWRGKTSLGDVLALVALMGGMLLTGSRTGTVVAGMLCASIVAHSWCKGLRGSDSFGRLFAKTLVLTACLVVGIGWMNHFASSQSDREGGLLHRISLLTSFKLSDGGISNDISVRERLAAQEVYWSLIWAKPWFGHGLGSEAYLHESGPIDLTSHSTLLTCWMQYGILYLVTFGLSMIRMCRGRRRADAEKLFGTNSVLQFVFITLLLFTVNGNILNTRAFYVVWALFFAAVQWPSCVDVAPARAVQTGRWASGHGAASPFPRGQTPVSTAKNGPDAWRRPNQTISR